MSWMVIALVALLIYSAVLTILALRLRAQRDDYRRASEIRQESIELTRQGRPPFLLNRGVAITVEDPQ